MGDSNNEPLIMADEVSDSEIYVGTTISFKDPSAAV